MPTLDFKCETPECEGYEVLDILVSMHHTEICPKCKKRMRVIIAPVGFQFSTKSSLPPTASSKFNDHMRSTNFKKRCAAHETMGKPVPNGSNVKARYFGMEEDVQNTRKYPAPTMKNMAFVEDSIKKKKPKTIVKG